MTALVWDAVGDRTYQTGVDRGVLYLPDAAGVVWNGLTSVEERPSHERKTVYLDSIKYLEHIIPSDFSAQLRAFTYPDEFDAVLGTLSDGGGLGVHDQRTTKFGLSYRTLIGDDVFRTDRGYRIHLLYNLTAVPDSSLYSSLNASPSPIEFGWSLSGTPVVVPGYRPTVHISLDSTKMDPMLFAGFEARLYGTDEDPARLPTFPEVLSLIETGVLFSITDNSDGTWTAVGPNDIVTVFDDGTFQISRVNATFLDAITYAIPITES